MEKMNVSLERSREISISSEDIPPDRHDEDMESDKVYLESEYVETRVLP